MQFELADGAAPQRLDRMVERAHALHGAEGHALRKGAVARVEVAGRSRERAVGVLFDEDIEPERKRLRQRWHRRKLRTLGVLLPVLLCLLAVVLFLLDARQYQEALAARGLRKSFGGTEVSTARQSTR